jgi:hypothetical protein
MVTIVHILLLVHGAHAFFGGVRPLRVGGGNKPSTLTMISIEQEEVSINTPTGPMRTVILRPNAPGKYPGIVFYSEIFQLTGPIMRSAQMFAGHGFTVAVPEIYHTTSPGWVGEYTPEGADEGNRLKVSTPVENYDGDSASVINFLKTHPACTGNKIHLLKTEGFVLSASSRSHWYNWFLCRWTPKYSCGISE